MYKCFRGLKFPFLLDDFKGNCQTGFPDGCDTSTPPATCYRVTRAQHPLQRLLWSVFNVSHSGGCAVVSHGAFNRHLLPTAMLSILLCLLLLWILLVNQRINPPPYFNGPVLLNCKSCLYRLHADPFSGICLGDIFSVFPISINCSLSISLWRSVLCVFGGKEFPLTRLCHVWLWIPLVCVLWNTALSSDEASSPGGDRRGSPSPEPGRGTI